MRLRTLVGKALAATAGAWPAVRRAFGWVHRGAAVLGNKRGLDAAGVRLRFRGLLGAIARHRRGAGELGPAIGHFLMVTRSYWPGLFACYDTADLPRTNNDLEQFFGSYRCHERRASGRKVASPGMVVRGSVRIVSVTASRLHQVEARIWPHRTGRRGVRCEPGWAAGRRSGPGATASVATPVPICDRLKRP